MGKLMVFWAMMSLLWAACQSSPNKNVQVGSMEMPAWDTSTTRAPQIDSHLLMPTASEPYKVVIQFNTLAKETASDHSVNEDWEFYSTDVYEAFKNSDVQVVYHERDFQQVPIRNANGELLTTVNIADCVQEQKLGFIAIENGKVPQCIPYNTEMAAEAKRYFAHK